MPGKNYHTVFYFLLSLSLYSCGQRPHEDIDYIGKDTKTIPIDILNYKSADFNDLFKIEKIIKLAGNDSVIIGQIDKINYSDNKFYVLDGKTNYIDVFDTTGRFLFKVSSIGEGKFNYFRVADFDVDDANQLIYVLDDYKRKLIVFSGKDGRPLEEKPLFDFTVNKFALDNNGKTCQLIYSRGGTAESRDNWYNLLVTDSANTILYHWLPYTSTASFIMSPEHPLQKTKERISYLPPFSGTIFGLNDDHTLSARYVLQFHGAGNGFEKMEADLRSNAPKTVNDFLHYLDENNCIKFLNYLETDSLLYIYYSTARQGNQFLIYDKNKDSSTLLLSTLQNNYLNLGQPSAVFKNQFIFVLQPDSFLDKKKIKTQLSLKDQQLFDDFGSGNNPMLVLLKPKSF